MAVFHDQPARILGKSTISSVGVGLSWLQSITDSDPPQRCWQVVIPMAFCVSCIKVLPAKAAWLTHTRGAPRCQRVNAQKTLHNQGQEVVNKPPAYPPQWHSSEMSPMGVGPRVPTAVTVHPSTLIGFPLPCLTPPLMHHASCDQSPPPNKVLAPSSLSQSLLWGKCIPIQGGIHATI